MKHDKGTFCDGANTVHVYGAGDGTVGIEIWGEDGRNAVAYLPCSDIPALGLAEMEAAGYSADITEQRGAEHSFAWAMTYLQNGIEAQAKATAEAEAQAKLEAEALELLNAHREATGDPFAESLDGLLYNAKKNWLAVARRARELAQEGK